MTRRPWLTFCVLAVFLTGPALQLQCQIACANDDGPAPCHMVGPVSLAATVVASPDDCPGDVDLGPMLPATTGASRHVAAATPATVLGAGPTADRRTTVTSISPSFDASSAGPPRGRRVPLRI